MSAAKGAHPEALKVLLDNGADVNVKSKATWAVLRDPSRAVHSEDAAESLKWGGNGWTVLLSAAMGGSLPVVRMLLDKGVDVNATDANGATALKIAQEKGYKEIVELLKAHGVKE